MGERRSAEHARLRWRCRRGMRELDAVLLAFLEDSYETLDEREKARFAAILDLPDPELYGYVVGRIDPPDCSSAALVARIRASLHF
jgi:antitoxin CptB